MWGDGLITANTIHAQQNLWTTALKSGCVMVWKMVKTVEATGLSH